MPATATTKTRSSLADAVTRRMHDSDAALNGHAPAVDWPKLLRAVERETDGLLEVELLLSLNGEGLDLFQVVQRLATALNPDVAIDGSPDDVDRSAVAYGIAESYAGAGFALGLVLGRKLGGARS